MIGDHNLGRKGACEWPHLVNSTVEECLYPSFPENSTLEPHMFPFLNGKKLQEE